VHRGNPLRPVGVAAAEEKGVILIPLSRVYQGLGNAVGNLRNIAVLQTPVALTDRRPLSSLYLGHKGIIDGPSRHSHGTLDDDDVLLLGLNIGLLVIQGSVALLRGHKAGGYLDPIGSQLQLVK